jgi:GrpB-like predicted nucleotidyltransferase (UPF0157 family)
VDELGLEKSEVLLRAHNPEWITLGRHECDAVRQLLGDHAIEVVHVGSTSVPGLDAKPILDIAASVPDACPIDDIIERLAGSGPYAYDGDRREDGGLLFVRGSGEVRTVHVHVVGSGSAAWQLYLRFHDLLLADAGARAHYASAKHSLADRFPGDRVSYTHAKGAVITELLSRWAEARPHAEDATPLS